MLCYWSMPLSAVDNMLAGDADANVSFTKNVYIKIVVLCIIVDGKL